MLSDEECFNLLGDKPIVVAEVMRAAYALGAERACVVKPLVWRAVVENEWFKTTDRHYEVFAQQGGSGDFYARDIWRGDTVIDGGSLDEAKAACQKYHEVFVLSQLELV